MFLKIENMCKTINNHKLFADVDISMSHGEIITIVGDSGCGKSSLLRILAGLDQDYAGTFILDETEMDNIKAGKRPVSLMFQEPVLFPHLNVLDNVSFPLKCQGYGKERRCRMAREVLANLKLQELENRLIFQLSGGQKQRVALARAIITKPKLLLLDEPFANLDLSLGREIMSFMKVIIQDYQITTIFVTHNYEEAKLMSKRIFVFNNQKIQEDSGFLVDEFFGDGLYFDDEFISMENLVLNRKIGLPVIILSKIKLHGVDFVLFKIEGGKEKLIKAPDFLDLEGQWLIERKTRMN